MEHLDLLYAVLVILMLFDDAFGLVAAAAGVMVIPYQLNNLSFVLNELMLNPILAAEVDMVNANMIEMVKLVLLMLLLRLYTEVLFDFEDPVFVARAVLFVCDPVVDDPDRQVHQMLSARKQKKTKNKKNEHQRTKVLNYFFFLVGFVFYIQINKTNFYISLGVVSIIELNTIIFFIMNKLSIYSQLSIHKTSIIGMYRMT